MTTKPKIAIFYDWLNQWGGAEKVLLDLIKIFPDSPIFTLNYSAKNTPWLSSSIKVIPSSIDRLPLSHQNPLIYTPFYPLVLEKFDFSQFDIVISTTSTVGHCLLTPPSTLFVCYFHNVNRYLYQTPKQFKFLTPFLKHYQQIDFIYGQRPDYCLCNSNTVKNRIQSAYHRPAQVIYPGVDTSFFVPAKKPQNSDYFLIVSRLVEHKKIDLAIRACQQTNKKLIIVGDGRCRRQLIKLADKSPHSQTTFTGKVSPKKLLYLYQNCQALICPQIEDFGLTPLEAQACGKPVIAFNKGGLTETVISDKTGIFFNHQTTNSLAQALIKFNPQNFSTTDCTQNAAKFSRKNFILNFKQTINQLWRNQISM